MAMILVVPSAVITLMYFMFDDLPHRPGTLSQISQQISSLNVSIQSISGKPMADDRYIIEMTFEVANTEQLNVIIRNLKKLKCVSEVYRMNR